MIKTKASTKEKGIKMKGTEKMKKIENKIKDWIKKNYPNGYTIYRDYNDHLSPNMIADCLERKNPMDAFYEYLFESYEEDRGRRKIHGRK